jgi:hypothetical protein
MRLVGIRLAIPIAAASLLLSSAAWAADSNSGSNSSTDQAGKSAKTSNADSGNGAAGSSGGAGNTMPDTIQLNDAQRQTIRQALAQEKTDEMFNEPGTKTQKDFAPAVGETVPAALHLQAMPTDLARKVPAVENYAYMKVKNQVLIVNPMSKKIVDMFPQQSG